MDCAASVSWSSFYSIFISLFTNESSVFSVFYVFLYVLFVDGVLFRTISSVKIDNIVEE